MITKEEFTYYITLFQDFEKSIERIENALGGETGRCYLFESDWYCSVCKMLDTFIDSHFTETGHDWIDYFLYEEIDDKVVTIEKEADLFQGKDKVEYHLNSIDELWKFLLTDPELYFKNYNRNE